MLFGLVQHECMGPSIGVHRVHKESAATECLHQL